MRDRTAMTEPLTIGQRIVAKWEGPASDWSEPADLAQAIDDAIAAEREACAKIADEYHDWTYWGQDNNFAAAIAASEEIAAAIRKGRWLTADEIQQVDKARKDRRAQMNSSK